MLIWNLGLIVENIQNQNQNQFWISIYIQIGIILIATFLSYSAKIYQNHLVKIVTLKTQSFFLNNIENSRNKNNTLQVGKSNSLIIKSIPDIVDKRVFQPINIVIEFLAFSTITVILFTYFWGLALVGIFGSFLLVIVSLLLSKKLMNLEVKSQKIILKSDQKFNILIRAFDKFFFIDKVANLGALLNKQSEKFTHENWKNKIRQEKVRIPILFLNLFFQVLISGTVAIFYLNSLVGIEVFASVPFFFGSLSTSLQIAIANFASYRSSKLVFDELMPQAMQLYKTKTMTIEKISFEDFNVNFEQKKLFKNNLTLAFKPKYNYLIQGPSGSGKSSIFRTIFDDDLTFEGKVLINNQPLANFNKKDLFAKISFVEYDSHIFDSSVLDNITLFEKFNEKEINEILKLVNLDHHYLSKKALSLSEGEKQRVSLASFLIRKPQIVVIDEGLSNLDHKTMNQILKNIIAEGIKIIHISHSKKIKEESYDQKINIQA